MHPVVPFLRVPPLETPWGRSLAPQLCAVKSGQRVTVVDSCRQTGAPYRASAMATEDSEHENVCSLILALTAFGNVTSESLGERFFDTGSKLIVLCVLSGGESTPRELGQVTRLSTSGVTRLLDRMEDTGWIRRRYGADPDDRRNVHVVLSAKGRRQTAAVVAQIGASLARNRAVVTNLRSALEPFNHSDHGW